MAHGELEGVAVLEVGDALIGVVVDEAAKVRPRDEAFLELQDELGLEEVPLVDALLGLGVALVHDEDGYRARARGQLAALGPEVAHVACRDVEAHAPTVRQLGATEPLRRERHLDRVHALGALPHLAVRVLGVFRRDLRVVAPEHLGRERLNVLGHEHADAER